MNDLIKGVIIAIYIFVLFFGITIVRGLYEINTNIKATHTTIIDALEKHYE